MKNNHTFHKKLINALLTVNNHQRGVSYLNIPVDIQAAKFFGEYKERNITPGSKFVDSSSLNYVFGSYFSRRKKVAFLIGGRVNNKKASKAIYDLSVKYSIPVATTLSGKGAFPENSPLSLGVYGFAGSYRAIELFNSGVLDALFVIGCDLNQRDTLNWCDELPDNEIVVIDDAFDIKNCYFHPSYSIFSDIVEALKFLTHKGIPECVDQLIQSRTLWVSGIRSSPLHDESFKEALINEDEKDGMHPCFAIREMKKSFSAEANVVVDSGAHRIFMAHYWESNGNADYFNSGSLAPMGWAVCAGVGIKLAQPERECVVVTGDGCMLMHGVEIQTAARYKVNVIYIVMNNSAHGAMYVDTIKGKGVSSNYSSLPTHDWVGFADSLGVKAERVKNKADLKKAFKRGQDYNGPYLIEIVVGNYATPNKLYAKSAEKYEKNFN